MMSFNEYMEQFSDSNLDDMIVDYEHLTKNGLIGNCLLRSVAEGWNENIGGGIGIIVAMRDVAGYAYRTRYHQLRNI